MAEIDNHAGEKTCLAQTEQKAEKVELVLRLHETSQNGNHAPRDHYARNPAASTPFFHQDAAGNLQQKIAPEKNAGAEAQDLVGERQLAFHLQRCVTNVYAVEISNDKESEKIRQQSPHDTETSAIADGGRVKLHGTALCAKEIGSNLAQLKESV